MSEDLPRATQVLRAGGWIERTAKDVVVLDFDDRFRRRKRFTGQRSTATILLAFITLATADNEGDRPLAVTPANLGDSLEMPR